MFNFSANPNIPYINCTQFRIEFPLFWTFNFSANLDIPYINNVQNFPLNFRSSGYSIFLQIQTFCAKIMYRISCLIYVILDIQLLCKSEHYVHFLYRISGFAEKLNIQNSENLIENCVHYIRTERLDLQKN